jgi:hypothetical protein
VGADGRCDFQIVTRIFVDAPPAPERFCALAHRDHVLNVKHGLAVFGFNVLGDALRDLLDPRLKGV